MHGVASTQSREATIAFDAVILFSGADTARQLVAGLPAGARAVREAALAGASTITLTTPEPWEPGPVLRAEAERLGGSARLEFATEAEALAGAGAQTLLVSGERLIDASALGRALAGADETGVAFSGASDPAALRAGVGRHGLRQAARRIVAATSKPGDGIVSRHINRPISQAISAVLLRSARIRPIHGTFGTALIALIMVAALFSGTPGGLVAGAVLFQAASIFDGVDGEIARATFRTSPEGARIDSMVDALTNVFCLAGVVFNLFVQGESDAALAGACGIVMLILGLTIVGRRARSAPGGMHFNALKEHFAAKRSLLMQWLTWLTMRDFFALAGAVLVVAGFAPQAMYAFAIVAAGWLGVVLAVMMRQSA